MFINKIEEAREFFDCTSIYIADPILTKYINPFMTEADII